jgi:hypothetical protein
MALNKRKSRASEDERKCAGKFRKSACSAYS